MTNQQIENYESELQDTIQTVKNGISPCSQNCHSWDGSMCSCGQRGINLRARAYICNLEDEMNDVSRLVGLQND